MYKTIEQLKLLPQWVGHKDKVPMNPHNGKAASSTNPATWATAVEAWQAKNRYRLDGIGFVFTIKAGVVGIDLDDCFEDGKLKSWAQDVVSCVNSYTELSPSGKGVHILALGEIPHSIKNGNGFEMYNEARYFTVTGNQHESIGHIGARQKEIDALFVTFGGLFDDDTKLPDVKPARRDTTIEDVKRALDCLPKWGDYNTFWLPVLMAVHDAFPNEQGVSLIEAWSPGKKGEVRRKFRSFDQTSKSGITVASLFHMAKDYGYRPSPPQGKKPLSHKDKLNTLMGY